MMINEDLEYIQNTALESLTLGNTLPATQIKPIWLCIQKGFITAEAKRHIQKQMQRVGTRLLHTCVQTRVHAQRHVIIFHLSLHEQLIVTSSSIYTASILG